MLPVFTIDILLDFVGKELVTSFMTGVVVKVRNIIKCSFNPLKENHILFILFELRVNSPVPRSSSSHIREVVMH